MLQANGARARGRGARPQEARPARAECDRPLRARGMDRRSRASARTAESGRQTAARPQGARPARASSPPGRSAKAAWTAAACATRTAESGRQTAARPQGARPARNTPAAPRRRHGPPQPSASPDSGKRTADSRATGGSAPTSPRQLTPRPLREAAWTAAAERQPGQRKADSGPPSDRRERARFSRGRARPRPARRPAGGADP